MPQPTSADVPRPATLRWWWPAAALFVVAAAGASWWRAGDLSEPIPAAQADHLWHPSTFLEAHELLVGSVSCVLLVATGVALLTMGRRGRAPSSLLAAVGVLALFAGWLGFGYRVATAGVSGANIGGGLVILVTPVIAVITCVVVVALVRRDRRPGRHGT